MERCRGFFFLRFWGFGEVEVVFQQLVFGCFFGGVELRGELRGSCGVDSGVVMREGGGCWGKGEGVEERESMYMKKK